MGDLNLSSRHSMNNEDILQQVRAVLDGPDNDLQSVILKEMIAGVAKLKDGQFDTLDLKILNRTLKELRHAFRVFQPYRHRRKVSIFGSARTKPEDPNYQLAVRFTRRLVELGFMVITGGADGIMRAGQEGAGKEHSFGVNIMLPFEQGANPIIADDPKLITFKYFFTRKLLFLKESHACALFPGGFGTHDECFELLTLAQTGKTNPQPIVFLQAPGSDYWNHWAAFMEQQLLAGGLINEEDLSLFKICTSEGEAVEEIAAFYRNYHSLRFVGRLLVIRIQQMLSEEHLARIRDEFADLLEEGTFEQRPALAEEADEEILMGLPRLVFAFNRRSAGRLRQLIDRLNAAVGPVPFTAVS